MNRNGIKSCLLIFSVCLLALLSTNVRAEDQYPASPPLFNNQELDDLLAPIALYPDPLLAEMLPASTYTEEIVDAYDWQNSGGRISEIDRQDWDESVKAVARYPDVLKMMAVNGDWTADLGDAFLNQPEDVTSSIQRLRWEARDAGNLESNSQQTIVIVGNYIEIVPAQPQYIYVPSYDPSIVYDESPYAGSEPYIIFGAGLLIGGWLTMDFDWDHHCVIYHGWNRSGWVNHARPYVHVDNIYAHKSRPYINNNWRHDASHGTPETFRRVHPGISSGAGLRSRMSEIRGAPATVAPQKSSPNITGHAAGARPSSNRDKDERGIIFSQPSTPQLHHAGDGFQRSRTPSVTFGGYRGADEARGQSLRGQTSRQSSEMAHPYTTTPTTQKSAPAGKGGAGSKLRR